jgi:putative ABC transport system permease protein
MKGSSIPNRNAQSGFIGHLVSAWVWRMAWRDSRTSRTRLLLFSGSIVLGIAALTAIGSLGTNLARAIEEQTKALLGADLVINSRAAFTAEQEAFLKSLGGEQSREVAFSTMIYFPRTENSRFAQVRAVTGGFPFYGQLETAPAKAAQGFRHGDGVLVEETLWQQFDAKIGDNLRVGRLTTRIAGRLEKVPGETAALAAIAPRVYLAMDDLPRTGLVQAASLVRYRVFFKFDPGINEPGLVRRVRPQLEKLRLGHETVEDRKRELGRALDNVYHFLNLVGFIALLLGGVGVASAIHTHTKQKLGAVAVLRCLGCPVAQTFAIYLGQGVALGCFGAVLGAALGVALQATLPRVLAGFIPFTFSFHTAWPAVARAMAIGFGICILFALLPLLEVRRVSPLAALRVSFEPRRDRRDPLRWLVGACLAAGVLAFAVAQTRNWRLGIGFAAGLAVVFGVLTAMAKLLIAATRRFVQPTLPFTARQGVANLYRPNNRTLLLLLALGLGTFLMMSLYLVQRTLLTQLVSANGPHQPNAVLFDIQTSQTDAVTKLIRSLGLPVLDEVPIVTMRLSSVKGRAVESMLSGRSRRGPGWALRREYRSTYGDHLRDGEKIIAGRWIARMAAGTNAAPISLEQGLARELQVGLGDELVFDVQGVPVATRVASLRTVEWRRIQPNFFVEFPSGVLESAPAMHVLVTRVSSSEASARMQRAVVKTFPNISVIDLTLVLQTVDGILGRISFVIRFMAMFTVLTGLFVLVRALVTGLYKRIQESLL